MVAVTYTNMCPLLIPDVSACTEMADAYGKATHLAEYLGIDMLHGICTGIGAGIAHRGRTGD